MMDSTLSTLGILFFLFFVLAAAVETLLETFRGTLEALGFTFLKGKYSVDDALKLASEFAPDNVALLTKLQAVRGVADQLGKKAAAELHALDELKTKVAAVGGLSGDEAAANLQELAAQIRVLFDTREGMRIFVLRLLSALIGGVLVWSSGFALLPLVGQLVHVDVSAFPFLQGTMVNILIGGAAASAGSSYWHDQLDKVRNFKAVQQQVSALTR